MFFSSESIFFVKGQSELKEFLFLKHKTLLPRLQSFSQGRGQIFLWCRKEDGSFGQDEECWLKWTRKSLKKIRLKEWWGGYWHPWNQLGTSQNPLCDNTQVFKWKERGDTGSLDFSVNFDQLIHKNHLHFCSCQTIWGESTHEVCEDQRRDKVSQKSEKNKRRKWKWGGEGNYPHSTKLGKHPLKPQKHFLLCESGEKNSTQEKFFCLQKKRIEGEKEISDRRHKKGRSFFRCVIQSNPYFSSFPAFSNSVSLIFNVTNVPPKCRNFQHRNSSKQN